MNINLRFLHKGQFYNGHLGRMCYKKGSVHYKEEVDPNILYKVVLEAMLRFCWKAWSWFLDILMRDIGHTKPTMSDRQKGLIEALHEVAPMADTRVCVRHLHSNFKVKWPGKTFKDILWAAARACTRSDFADAMEEIKKLDEGAYNYLMNANPKTWSKHAFRHYTKSNMLLNNVCEGFNAYILRARDKPILTMCEWIRRQLMKRFVNKREGMSKYT